MQLPRIGEYKNSGEFAFDTVLPAEQAEQEEPAAVV
jgi:hypothetical protein